MAISEVTLSKCSEHLSAYKSACENHPDLKSFNSSLQQRTNKAIDSLTAEAEKRTNIVKDLLTAKAEKRPFKETVEAETKHMLSQYAVHKEVSSHVHEVFQDVADFIVENKDDAWGKNLNSLVHAYLDGTQKTITILKEVENRLDKADDGKRFILQAVAQFDKDSAEIDVAGKKKKYEKTLDKLKKFKAIGDPFSGLELKTQLELVKNQQESLLNEMSEAMKKLHEEIDHLHQARKISNGVFGAAFAVTVLVGIGLFLIGGPLAVGFGVGLGLSLPLTAIGWVATDTILARQEEALKKQEEALKELKKKYETVGHETEVEIGAMKSVSDYVDSLEKKISSMLEVVDDVIENEEDEKVIRIDLDSIGENVKKLTEGIKEVGEAVSRAWKLIDNAKNHVLEKISDSA